jgi:hypothetical protein
LQLAEGRENAALKRRTTLAISKSRLHNPAIRSLRYKSLALCNSRSGYGAFAPCNSRSKDISRIGSIFSEPWGG